MADFKENDEQELLIFAEWGRGLCKKVTLIILPVVVGVMVVVVLVEVVSCWQSLRLGYLGPRKLEHKASPGQCKSHVLLDSAKV